MSELNSGGIPRLREPNVKLPKAVQLQGENVKRLIAARTEEVKAAMVEKFNEHTPSGNQSVNEPPKVVEAPKEEPKKAEVQSDVKPEVKNEPNRDSQYWEHRFKTNQGIHEAEKTRFKSQITTLETRLSDLEKQLRESNKKVSKEVDISKYVTSDEVETYGKEMLNTVARTANKIADEAADHRIQEAISREVTPIRSKLEETEAKLAQTQQDKFWDHLNTEVSDWPRINNDTKFHEWLQQVDPLTGYQRQQLLTNAEQALDSRRVVAIFNTFLQTSPASNKPTVQELERKVVPEPIAAPVDTQTQVEVNRVSRAEISRFYKDKALGRYRNRPQEAEQIEKKIQTAVRMGNVF